MHGVGARDARGGCARDVAMMMGLGKRADSSRVWIGRRPRERGLVTRERVVTDEGCARGSTM